MPWSLPFYAEAIAVDIVEEVLPMAAPKRPRLCFRGLKYMDMEVIEDSHESESEEDYNNDAFDAIDVIGSN